MDRKSKYALIKKTTGNSELARRARDWSDKRIQKEIIDFYSPVLSIKRAKRAETRSLKYSKARNAGYTPKEATKMQDWSIQHINRVIKNEEIVDSTSRRNRWKSMSKRRAMDYNLEYMAHKFNKRKGLRKNHGFGWGIVYTAYTKGIDPERLYKATKIDPFIPEIYKLPNSL